MSRRVALNAISAVAGAIVGKAITALATIAVIRVLGPDGYGSIAVAFAWGQITGYITDLGLNHLYLREASRPGADRDAAAARTLKLRLALAGSASAVVALLAPVVYGPSTLSQVVWLVAVPSVWGGALQGFSAVYFQAQERLHITALVQILGAVASAVALALGLVVKARVEVLAGCYGGSQLLLGLLAFWPLRRLLGVRVGRAWLEDLRRTGPFVLAGALATALPQMGPILLERVAGVEAAGTLASCSRIASMLYLVPGAVATAFYPALHRTAAQGEAEFRRTLVAQVRTMVLLALVLTLPLALYAEGVTHVLFGARWDGIGPLVRMTLPAVLLQAVSFPLAQALIVEHRERVRAWVLLVAVLAAAVAYCGLGARLGAAGGIAAALLGELVLLVGYTFRVTRGVSVVGDVVLQVLKPAAGALLVGGAVRGLLKTPLVGAALAGIGAVAALLALDTSLRSLVAGALHARRQGRSGASAFKPSP